MLHAPLAARRAALRRGQLRRALRELPRLRAVRAREGRIHRRQGPEARPLRAGRRRDALPRRDGRPRARPAAQAAQACWRRRRFRRLGGTREIEVDVRLVAATNRDLAEAVPNGTLPRGPVLPPRRLPVHLPPLREREPSDITVLASCATDTRRRLGRGPTQFSARRSSCCWRTDGRATSASCATWWSGSCSSRAPPRRSAWSTSRPSCARPRWPRRRTSRNRGIDAGRRPSAATSSAPW